MRNILIVTGGIVAVAAIAAGVYFGTRPAAPGPTPVAVAATPDKTALLAVLPSDHVLGKPNAPNIIIDYFSLTCPHCANFSAAVLPVVKSEWIDTGRVRFIYRHFPSDSVATHAAQLAEGAGRAKFYDAVSTLFRSQVDWLTASDPESEMVKAVGEVGLSAAAARACFADDRLLDKVIADVQSGQSLQEIGRAHV